MCAALVTDAKKLARSQIKKASALPKVGGTLILKTEPLVKWLTGCKKLSAMLSEIYGRPNPWVAELDATELRKSRQVTLLADLVAVLEVIKKALDSGCRSPADGNADVPT